MIATAAAKAVPADETVREKHSAESDTSSSKQSKDDTTNNTDKEKLKYYLVKADGTKQLLTSSFGEEFSEVTANFNLADYFEDDNLVAEREISGRDEGERNLSSVEKVGLFSAAMPAFYMQSKKHELVEHLKSLSLNHGASITNSNGALVEAGYQVARTETGFAMTLDYVKKVREGSDYRSLIKSIVDKPAIMEKPINEQHHWEFVFIWVIK